MQAKIKYDFSAKLWKDSSAGGWFFVSLPKDISKEIRENLQWQEEGWGRMKVSAIIDKIEWDTSIWYDTKINTHLLPIKADIRNQTNIKLNEEITVSILV